MARPHNNDKINNILVLTSSRLGASRSPSAGIYSSVGVQAFGVMYGAGVDVAISGSSGLIGTALSRSLEADGHRCIRLVRREVRPGADEVFFDPAASAIDGASLEAIDAIVNLAGAPIGTRPWTSSYKEKCVSSRVQSTALLATTCAALERPPRTLLSGSAIGYYGSGAPGILDESSPNGEGFLADLCVRWEAAAQPAVDAGLRTVALRTGLVMAYRGGLLSRLGPLFKLGLGGRLGDGQQYMSWISIDDVVGALRFLLEHDTGSTLRGPVNLVAPNPVTNAEFTTSMGSVLGRPAFLNVPAFVPRLGLGKEMASEFILADQRVEPAALVSSGFNFQHEHLEDCLRSVFNR